MGESKINTATALQTNCIRDFCEYCGLDGASFHNAWMRKTYSLDILTSERLLITLSLGDLMLEEEKVMAITKHKSVQQMRKDYGDYHLLPPSASVVCPTPHYHPSGYL